MANARIATGEIQTSDATIGNSKPSTPPNLALLEACKRRQLSIVDSLLQKKVDVNANDEHGLTPLHVACMLGSVGIVKALLSYNGVGVAKCTGANDDTVHLDAKDSLGQTPLHLAAYSGHEKIVAELINDSRSSYDVQDCDGWTPLMCATRQGHAAIVKQLLPKSEMSITDNQKQCPLDVAKHRNELEVMKAFWEHLNTTGPPESAMSLLTWASKSFARHDFANFILLKSDPTFYRESINTRSAIERAALSLNPEVLWWLIATSPYDRATRCVAQATRLLSPSPRMHDGQKYFTEFRLIAKDKGRGGSMEISPTRQQTASVPTKGGDLEVLMPEILEILKNPPFRLVYQENQFHGVKPGVLAKDYRANVIGFFKNQSASSTIHKVLSVDDVVYRRGPEDIMKERAQRAQSEKKYMEQSKQRSTTADLYHKDNAQFTWVHLPATKIDWMEVWTILLSLFREDCILTTSFMHADFVLAQHLAQKIASEETGLIHDKYSEIKSFFQSTWFQIPDQQAKSRIMRPTFAERKIDIVANEENENQNIGEQNVESFDPNEMKQQMKSNDNSINCSAVYMPFLSFSTHLRKPSLKPISGDNSITQEHPESLVRKFGDSREKYDRLMPKSNADPVKHPIVNCVVHGCPTLDEAFYHFATDAESQEEEEQRNHTQVVSKQLDKIKSFQTNEKQSLGNSEMASKQSKATDCKDELSHTQTILRVSQIWIWTIGEKWLISACSHPVDDVEELWIDGFIDHLQKDARAKGALSEPKTANEMIKKMTTYCIGSYERRRTYEKVSPASHHETERQIGEMIYGLSIRQLFWNHINQTGRKETTLFQKNHSLMDRYQGNFDKKRYTDGGRELVKSVKQAIFTAEELFSEVKDIRDELGILQWIVSCQEIVQKRLPGNKKDKKDRKDKKDTSNLTVEYVMKDIERMEQLASRIQENANSTLSLLQNEITTLETEEALNQGRVFMVFTVLTIVFLPMSFLTSLFAMEADQINSQPGWSFGVIFGAGVLITIPSIIFTWPWTIDWLRPIFKNTSQSSDATSHSSMSIASGATTSATCWSAVRFAGARRRNHKRIGSSDMDVEKGGSS